MIFAATWIDPRAVILNELNQTEKDKCHLIPLICGILGKSTSELIYKTQRELQTQKISSWLLGHDGKEKMNWQIGIDIHTIIYKIDNKDLPYSTRKSIQYSVITYMRKESKKE